MAVASTELNNFRSKVRSLIESMRDIDDLLAIIEDHGANDAARLAFFSGEVGTDTNNPDIDVTELTDGIVGIRALRSAWESNRLDIAKLLK